MNIPTVHVPVIVDGARGGADQGKSGEVPLQNIAPTVKTGEVLWMSKGRDYRIQLKGIPRKIVGDTVIPEQARFAQFESFAFKSSDPEINAQLEASSARNYDFWKMSDLHEKRKASEENDLIRAAERVIESGDEAAMERLSVMLGQKGFALPKKR